MKLMSDEARFVAGCLKNWPQGKPGWTLDDDTLDAAIAHPESGCPAVALAVYRNGGAADITKAQVAQAWADMNYAYVMVTDVAGLRGDVVNCPDRLAKVFEEAANLAPAMEWSDAAEPEPAPQPRRVPPVKVVGVVGPRRSAFGGMNR